MTGAIEFLRKAKSIKHPDGKREIVDMIIRCIWGGGEISEADLVRKVMGYRLEDGDEQ